MQLGAYYKSTDLAVMITISITAYMNITEYSITAEPLYNTGT